MHIEVLNGDISNRELEVPQGTTYEKILETLGLNQETVLLLNNGQAVPVDGAAMSGNLTLICIASQG
ncbi:MAG: sulfur carrier protein [Methanolobus sp.]|jgi:sulfur carrier protein|nr:sulfur carrier protein [Methanolobus sp.]MDK2834350.1 sulfur carrier protein [Methanolobus sp.]MDK2911765.1 sulfur carrier protein [Methanolobus sp.]MDN5309742.1 sulfur carrier protein [Methanolobus sp.]